MLIVFSGITIHQNLTMSILLAAPGRDLSKLKKAILNLDDSLDIDIWPAIQDKKRVHFAVCWNHPDYMFQQLPNLKAASSLGAGADHLLNDEALSDDIPVCRLITPSLKSGMADFALHTISCIRHHQMKLSRQKNDRIWEQHSVIPRNNLNVGIMGMGEMGRATAELLIRNGYTVNGWSRSGCELEGLNSFKENELSEFLGQSNILICLLPLTGKTRDILDLELMKMLRKPAYLINLARGEHLVEEDLLYALDTGIIEEAWLDVFDTEPLPDKHVFWNRKNIMVSPHIAAITPAGEAAGVIVENYKRTMSGQQLLYPVARKTGY